MIAMNKTSILSMLAFVCLLAVSCQRRPGPVEEVDEYAFEFDVAVTHGLRNDTEVIDMPAVYLTITKGDDAADYEVYYTINGRDGRTMKNVWVGDRKDLSPAFSNCTDYGTYILKGDVYRSDGKGAIRSFEEPVYMGGEQIVSMSAVFSVGTDNRQFSSPLSFYVSEKGTLKGTFSPKTAHVVPEVSVEGDASLKFDVASASQSGGVVLVPFEVTSAGSGKIVFTLRTGEVSKTVSQEFTAIEDNEHVFGFDVDVSAPSSVQAGKKLPVTVTLTSGDPNAKYDIAYSIDGASAGSDKGVSLATARKKDLDAGKAVRTRTLSVTVSRQDGMYSTTKEIPFAVTGIPVSDVKVTCQGTTVASGRTVELLDPSNESLTVSVQPADAMVNSITVTSGDESVLSVSGSGTSWRISSGSAGFGTTYLTVSVSGIEDYSFTFPVAVSRTVPVQVVQSESPTKAPVFDVKMGDASLEGKGIVITVSAVARYHGTCWYYEAYGNPLFGDDFGETQVTKDTEPKTAVRTVQWTASTSLKEVIDLSSEKEAIEAMTETGQVWDDGNPANEWRIMNDDAPYYFYFDGLDLKFIVKGPSGLEGLLKVSATQ